MSDVDLWLVVGCALISVISGAVTVFFLNARFRADIDELWELYDRMAGSSRGNAGVDARREKREAQAVAKIQAGKILADGKMSEADKAKALGAIALEHPELAAQYAGIIGQVMGGGIQLPGQGGE